MRRIRVNNKTELRNALETIILSKLEQCEKELENEIIKAENNRQTKRDEDYYRFLKKLKPVAFEFWPQFKLKLNIPFVCPDPLSDWWFNGYSWDWGLTTSKYHSPPSSLLFNQGKYLLCIKPGAYPIQEGRINTWIWFRNIANSGLTFLFRNQGPGNQTKSYFAYLYGSSLSIMVYSDQNYSETHYNAHMVAQTWCRHQVKFWVSEDHLVARWEYWSNDEWVQDTDDFTDHRNSYYGNQTNYCGIFGSWGSGYNPYIDDTEIWKAS